MATPKNIVYVQGANVIDDDGLNTFVQWCDIAASLRNFVGNTNMVVLLEGIESVDDGLGAFFYWNPTSTAADNNATVIVPYGVVTGAWIRLGLDEGGGGGGAVVMTTDLVFRYDGGGVTPAPGVLGDGIVDFGCTITGWTIQADQAGAIALDIWKSPYTANTPPTIANTIVASLPPAIFATNESARSSTLTGWTTVINAGDWLRFNLTSITTITRFTLTLAVSRSLPVT